MTRVFISYASVDLPLAAELHDWLASDGHEVFLDRDPRNGIAVGDEWVRRLHERLRWANALVCVITKDYQDSAWCTAELNTARLLGTRILPVRSGDVRHPLLDDVQHTDLTDPGLARERTARALDEIDAAGDAHWPDGRSPFPGLVPLDVDRHRVFFGREREVADLAELIGRDDGAVLVVGPSGCGKSSLVRAGLVPAMTGVPGVFPLPVVVPGHDPAAALGHVLTQPVRPRPLLVIDQLEEVFTLSDAGGRAEFAQRLRDTTAHVVCTIRPEYLTELLSDPHLADLCKHVYAVTPLRPEALRQVVERPAAIAGITVDERLTARMIEDTGDGTALPLLAFTLAELSDGVRRGGKLSPARYDALGGVRGALVKEADAALKAASSSERDVLAALLSLVTVDERGQPTRRHVERGTLPDLTEFVTRRLLTTDTIAGEVVIGVAHEAFLTEWPPLAEAITEHAAALRTRRAVEHAAEEWRTAGRTPFRLWQGAHLHAAREEVTRVDLTTTAREFLHASVRHDRRRRTRTVTVLSVLLVVALVGAAVAYNRQLTAQDRQAEAEERQRAAVAQQLVAQAAAFGGAEPQTALLLGIAAVGVDPGSTAAKAGLAQTLAAAGYAGGLPGQHQVTFARHTPLLAGVGDDGAVTLWSAAVPGAPRRGHRLAVDGTTLSNPVFAPDGRTLVTAADDGKALLWDLTGTAPRRVGPPLSASTRGVKNLAFTADSTTLAAADGQHVLLWNVSDPARPHLISRSSRNTDHDVLSVSFTSDGKLLTTGLDVLDVTDPAGARLVSELPRDHGRLRRTEFSPDGKLIAGTDGAGDGGLVLVDMSDPAHPRIMSALPTQAASISDLAFSPDGRMLATAGAAGATALWDITDPSAPHRIDEAAPRYTSATHTVSFSPDGRTLAVDGDLWELTGRFRPTLLGAPFGGGVHSLAFSPHGRVLALGGEDRATLWLPADPAVPLGVPLTGISPGRPADVAFSPDGRTLAAGQTLQDVMNPERPGLIHELPSMTGATRFSPDGKYLVTTSLTGRTATLWSARDPSQRVAELRGHDSRILATAFSQDSRWIAATGTDSTVRVWDVSDPKSEIQGSAPLIGQASDATTVSFSPDDQLLLAGGSPALLWETHGGKRGHRVGRTLMVNGGAIVQLAFAPRSRLLATGSSDGTVALWDLSDSATPRRLGPPLAVRSVGPLAFSPEGTMLATGDRESGVRLWDLRSLTSMLDNPLEAACGILGTGLSEQDWPYFVPGLPYRRTCS